MIINDFLRPGKYKFIYFKLFPLTREIYFTEFPFRRFFFKKML